MRNESAIAQQEQYMQNLKKEETSLLNTLKGAHNIPVLVEAQMRLSECRANIRRARQMLNSLYLGEG